MTGTQGQTRGECYKPSVQFPVQTWLGQWVTGTQGQTRGECYKPSVQSTNTAWSVGDRYTGSDEGRVLQTFCTVYKHGLVSG